MKLHRQGKGCMERSVGCPRHPIRVRGSHKLAGVERDGQKETKDRGAQEKLFFFFF